MDKRSICPICGKYEFTENFDICPYCNWENDPVQRDDPSYIGGANKTSIEIAKEYFELGKKIAFLEAQGEE